MSLVYHLISNTIKTSDDLESYELFNINNSLYFKSDEGFFQSHKLPEPKDNNTKPVILLDENKIIEIKDRKISNLLSFNSYIIEELLKAFDKKQFFTLLKKLKFENETYDFSILLIDKKKKNKYTYLKLPYFYNNNKFMELVIEQKDIIKIYLDKLFTEDKKDEILQILLNKYNPLQPVFKSYIKGYDKYILNLEANDDKCRKKFKFQVENGQIITNETQSEIYHTYLMEHKKLIFETIEESKKNNQSLSISNDATPIENTGNSGIYIPMLIVAALATVKITKPLSDARQGEINNLSITEASKEELIAKTVLINEEIDTNTIQTNIDSNINNDDSSSKDIIL